jgi:DNA mismatch repair protein MutS
VREWKDEIIFLHQVEKGAADKSYGIHVAEIAGIPAPVIDRARELLSSMEINLLSQEDKLLKHGKSEEGSLFAVPKDDFEKVKSRILGVDINHTTPLQALLLLEEVQRELRKKK